MSQITSVTKVVPSIVPTIGTAGAQTNIAIDGSGYDRVRHIITIGAITSSGTITCKVTESAGSTGSYADVTSAALATIADTGGSSIYTIDCPISGTKPFQKLVLTTVTQAGANSACAELYNGSRTNPNSAPATQAIIV